MSPYILLTRKLDFQTNKEHQNGIPTRDTNSKREGKRLLNRQICYCQINFTFERNKVSGIMSMEPGCKPVQLHQETYRRMRFNH